MVSLGGVMAGLVVVCNNDWVAKDGAVDGCEGIECG